MSSSQRAQPDLGNASLDPRELGAEQGAANDVPLFSGASLVRALVDSLIGNPAFSIIVTGRHTLVCVERKHWWAFCGECWSPIGVFSSEAVARFAPCRVCSEGRSVERLAALFIESVRHATTVTPDRVSSKVVNFEGA